ncbi:MAG TPA: mycofactocin-coupled SDR family oxidoreductase [Conexibacter sp.]|nr:mycofactocin-coupled SDR family oxidoreductase [Conexibacter sp.]
MGRLDGKVALITGGARGQGRSHAVTLAREGAQIVVTDVCERMPRTHYDPATEADLAETARLVEALGRRCIAIKADARRTADMNAAVERTIAELGRIDVVVANAGIVTLQDWDGVDDEVWDETIATNLTGVWRTIRPAIPHMVEAGGGSIVITASSAALHGHLGLLPYAASKGGVVGLMKSLAAELGPHSIRVNCVSPGTTATPMVHTQHVYDLFAGREGGTIDDVKFPSAAMMLLPIPWLEPQDQSNAVLFLASDEARYITGVNLAVDAGQTDQPPGIPPIASQRLAELGG